jgi:surface polysaccharide O-acyltransferase-like enzyme
VSDRFITKAHRQENCTISKGRVLSQNSHASPAAARPEYLFVDAVRFWSMLAVVALHSTQWIGAEPSEGLLPFAVACLFKYGTIGFPDLRIPPWRSHEDLCGVAVSVAATQGSTRSLGLLVRSLHPVPHRFRPWPSPSRGFDSVVTVSGAADGRRPCSVLHVFLVRSKSRPGHVHPHGLPAISVFGAVLFLVNFLYVADIYGEWFPPQHTVALFAFVSYLWLGSYAARNLSRVSAFMENMPMVLIAALVGLSYVASIAEFKILMARHSIDPSNTLRLSNQVFSILVVLLLFKLKSASWPGFIHVREQTFSIYLLHNFFLRMGSLPLNHWFIPRLAATLHPSISFLSRAALFLFAYGGSLLVGRWIASSDRWRWTIGLKSRQVLTTYEKTSTASKIKALILADTWPAK